MLSFESVDLAFARMVESARRASSELSRAGILHRLVGGVADDGLNAGDARHHRRQVASVAEVTPVGGDAPDQADRPPQVEHPAGRVAEPVHARCRRQPLRQFARPGMARLQPEIHNHSLERTVVSPAPPS